MREIIKQQMIDRLMFVMFSQVCEMLNFAFINKHNETELTHSKHEHEQMSFWYFVQKEIH